MREGEVIRIAESGRTEREIAQENPEFEYVLSATIELRHIRAKEVETRFICRGNSF